MLKYIDYDGIRYWYIHRLAKDGEICLGTTDPEKYCNGVYAYSSKDLGDGMAFVVVDHEIIGEPKGAGDDYPVIERETSNLIEMLAAKDKEIAELKAWKEGALQVIMEWEKVFELVNSVKPGKIGTFKSKHVLEYIKSTIKSGVIDPDQVIERPPVTPVHIPTNHNAIHGEMHAYFNQPNFEAADTMIKAIAAKDKEIAELKALIQELQYESRNRDALENL